MERHRRFLQPEPPNHHVSALPLTKSAPNPFAC
jgi:hypothetical protein